jgi:Cytochrome c, mono- and diheme variants
MKSIKIIVLGSILALLAGGCFVGSRDPRETRYPKNPMPLRNQTSTLKTAEEIVRENIAQNTPSAREAAALRDRVTPIHLQQVNEQDVAGNDPFGSPARVVLDEQEMYRDPVEIYREGRALFQNNCVGCHGHNGCGNVPRSTNFTDPGWQENNSDGGIYSSIYNGKGIGNGGGAMPAYYNQLSSKQIRYLVAYLRAFKGRQCNGLPTLSDVERMVAERRAKS